MSVFEKYENEVQEILEEIRYHLQDRETFGRIITQDLNDKVRFCGILTTIPRYIYYGLEVDENDFANPIEIANRFVTEWCKVDNPDNIQTFKQFIEDGEKWGWD